MNRANLRQIGFVIAWSPALIAVACGGTNLEEAAAGGEGGMDATVAAKGGGGTGANTAGHASGGRSVAGTPGRGGSATSEAGRGGSSAGRSPTGGAGGAAGSPTGTGGSDAGQPGSGGTTAGQAGESETGAAGAAGSDGDSRPILGCSTAFTTSQTTNYLYKSELHLHRTLVKPDSDLTFDWSAVETDMSGRPFDLANVGMLEIGLWNMTPEALTVGLRDDTLRQSDLAFIAAVVPEQDATTGALFDLTEAGEPVEPSLILPFMNAEQYPPEVHVYTAILAEGMNYGMGTRMIEAFQLDPNTDNTTVALTSNSARFDVTVNLHSSPRIGVPANENQLVIDWTGMTYTAQGLPFDPQQITRVRVANFRLSPRQMEQDFVNLETLAERVYSDSVKSGTTFDLSQLKDENGVAFPGIDGVGNWVVALDCAECSNPAPWYMAFLAPCSPGP